MARLFAVPVVITLQDAPGLYLGGATGQGVQMTNWGDRRSVFNDYGVAFYANAADSQPNIYFASDQAPPGLGGALLFGAGGGSAPDVNLYRAGANVLATEDEFRAGSHIHAGVGAGGGLVSGRYFATTLNAGGPYFDSQANTGATTGWVLRNQTAATNVPLSIQGMAAQSGDLQRWIDSGGTVLVAVNKDGRMVIGGTNTIPAQSGRLEVANAAGDSHTRLIVRAPDADNGSAALFFLGAGATQTVRGALYFDEAGKELVLVTGGTHPIRFQTNNTERIRIAGNSNDLDLGANTKLQWGTAFGTNDTNLYRSAANALKTDDALEVAGALTNGGTGVSLVTHSHAGIGGHPDVQTFTANGTWTKPSGVTAVKVMAIGGGGGGGSGRKGASSTNREGGSAGAGAALLDQVFPASILGATETVTVGAGGTGAAAQATGSSGGLAGNDGGPSGFGTLLSGSGTTAIYTWATARGGGAGQGGTQGTGGTGSATGGAASYGGFSGANSLNRGDPTVGGGTNPGNSTSSDSATRGGCASGGGGGGFDNTNAARNGGVGGDAYLVAGGTRGISGGAAPGSPTNATSGEPRPGAGGGGGQGGTTGNAGAAGGNYGGGGGGGGAGADAGTSSGAGGNGGAGIVVVISW